MRIAQLSDPHLMPGAAPLYGTVDTEAGFTTALARAVGLAPDLLLLSGDLANQGDGPTYRRLCRALEATRLPYAVMPGNHDHRAALRAAFPAQAWEGESLCCQRLEIEGGGGGRLLLLDSTVPGEEWGEIGEAQLTWLAAACPDARPTLLFLHHPPFAIGITGMDAIRCRSSKRLANWLAGQKHVEAVLCGHVHRFVATTFAGRPASTAPSSGHQIALQDGPLAYTQEPGGFLLHDWEPGVRLTTHYVPAQAAPVHVYTD